MPTKPQVRLPVEPLLEITGAVHAVARTRIKGNDAATGADAPVTSLARMISVRPRTIHRWRNEGGIPFYSADQAAGRVGRHPAEVWDDYWTASMLQGEIDDTVQPHIRVAKANRRARRLLVRDYQRIERARARMVTS